MNLQRAMDAIGDIELLGGACLVAYGSWLAYQPAGFIVGGALLLTGALLSARGG